MKVLAIAGSHVVLVLCSIVFAIPFLWLVSTSVKPLRQVFDWPPVWIPNPIVWQNYPDVFDYAPFHLYLVNTLIIAVANIVGPLLSCSLAAYGFARLRAPGRDVIFFVLISTMMVPGIVTLVPLYILFSKLDWINTFYPLTVPVLLGSPFTIFLLRQFFLTIPIELEEAAIIDGSSRLGLWWRILMPLCKPALATVCVFGFLHAWNDFTGPLIYLNDQSKYTLSLGLQVFQRAEGSQWGLLMAASTMVTFPVIVVFFLAQRQFIQGITLTGIKG
ncbi:MAG: carbohydrate ABC transporter permease [Chloroflexi bacterium]|nr:carbohydrate ABC transporter permease [Chloroflexota bacterium]